MNLLFWNLNRNSNEQLIVDLIIENNIDIAVFSEYSETNFTNVLEMLDNGYHRDFEAPGVEKTLLICRNNFDVHFRRDHSRYTIYSVAKDMFDYIIAGIHLPSNPQSNSDDRKSVIGELVLDIQEQERMLRHTNTIVIGDFNAVLFKDLIDKSESVIHQKHRYKRFYNPMLQVFSEDQKDYGSFYYCSGIKPLYWYCYDQVLVRKSLVDMISKVKYCKKIGNMRLLGDVMPRKEISDHLPLIVNFERRPV